MPAVLIREVTRADRAALAFSYKRLGDGSRYQRFLAARTQNGELARLTGVDHWHHEALMAFSPLPRAPIGVAEYVRLEEFDAAEVAVAIVDRWQRQGVGHALIAALRARALGAGIRRFVASTLRGNKDALALARACGRCTVVASEHGVLQLVIEL